ncbi:peptidoglycan recognition family protein [Rhodanobacter sp. MP7CTX1]|uniref:peptidoglycan recognition protein family protein n=1 Tax=Rhodanobacter sp. MP7CTX1 TaxID=2723084 RepID=UPI00161BCACE|nr:peptidoglycan recognition family protein [Rhodanobacter sp. MP7CTX1]MBB6186429.1 hypothetical protein [Rhodanobacter sp. MP7CTX1]
MTDYTITRWTHASTMVGSSKDDAIEIIVNNRAATRQAIIDALTLKHFKIKTRSAWKAKEPATSPGKDWDYTAIAIHHAGNSFSCAADGADEMRKAEAIDLAKFGQVSYHYAIDCQGTIYEALDIRYKGRHIKDGNAGVIGIVFLADFSTRGEAEKYGPGVWNTTKEEGVKRGISEGLGVLKDEFAVNHDEPSERQLEAASALTKTLTDFFNISTLGGHREFAKALMTSRACPGVYGMIIAGMLRRELELAAP